MKKNSTPKEMAGEQNSYLRFRVPHALKEAFEAKCDARGAAMSKVVRNLLEAYNRADEARDPLVAPLVVSSTRKKTTKAPKDKSPKRKP